MQKHYHCLVLILLSFLLFNCEKSNKTQKPKLRKKSNQIAQKKATQKPNDTAAQKSVLKNGVYLIHKSFDGKTPMTSIPPHHKVLTYDEKHLGKGKIEVNQVADVPFILERDPKKLKQKNGKVHLSITLDQKHKGLLASFTRKHINRSIALVVSGKIISMHKIKAAITGGKMQITYCYDGDCSVLLTELKKGLTTKR